ncbi:hypothetical protein LINGRAHAP2_LOCUS17299, partial [Linum grandiflorum]
QSGHDRCRVSLLACVFWPLPKPLYALHHDIARQWKVRPREVQVFEAGHGLIQFMFTSEEAKTMVLQHQLWCYKNHIINFVPWETPLQLVFDQLQFMAFTVQLLEVPPHCITTEFGVEILAPVGEVLSADIYTARPNGAGRPFLKATVRMDLMASFPGKEEAVIPNEPSFDVLLGYEGLPAICFLYGLLGHIQRSCGHAPLISPTPGLHGMWMLAKPSGYLLKDIDIPHIPTPRRDKSKRPPRLPPPTGPSLLSEPATSCSGSLPLAPASTPEVPLINGMTTSSIVSIQVIESLPLSPQSSFLSLPSVFLASPLVREQ